MVALIWDKLGERFYEAGVDRGVFYPKVGAGVAWNGLVSVTDKISGGEHAPIYLDGKKTEDLIRHEDFQAIVEAFSAPAGFLVCDGFKSIAPGLYVTQQPRVSFGFSYRTFIGNDVKQNEYSYKIHIVYNVMASPTDRTNKTLSESTELSTLKWTVDAVPPAATAWKPSAHLVIDTSLITSSKRIALENLLYGTSSTNPSLPTQSAVVALLV
jgi:hypothetical protein